MKQTKRVHIEDTITARLRLDYPGIQRIGVERGPDGWRCHYIWLHKGKPRLRKAETVAILAEGNTALAELLQKVRD